MAELSGREFVKIQKHAAISDRVQEKQHVQWEGLAFHEFLITVSAPGFNRVLQPLVAPPTDRRLCYHKGCLLRRAILFWCSFNFPAAGYSRDGIQWI